MDYTHDWTDRQWSIDAWNRAAKAEALHATNTSRIAELEAEIEQLRSTINTLTEAMVELLGG